MTPHQQERMVAALERIAGSLERIGSAVVVDRDSDGRVIGASLPVLLYDPEEHIACAALDVTQAIDALRRAVE